MISSKRKLNFLEGDRERSFYNSIFQDFLNKNNIKLCSRNSALAAVFAERLNRTVRNLLKRPVFERGDANWVDVLPRTTKQYNNRIHSLTKLTPIQASLKKNEGSTTKGSSKRSPQNSRFKENVLKRRYN